MAMAAKQPDKQAPNATAIAPVGVFQSLEFETNATQGLGNWVGARKRLAAESALYKACDTGIETCPPKLRLWRESLAKWKGLSDKAKLINVNRFANSAIRYVDDRKAFRKADYWASPAESLRGRGDCEDYVLLKYVSLLSLGFREDQLRVVIVNDLAKGIGHAVLSVRTTSGTFILDNQDQRVLRHDTIARYAPVYSVNGKGRWINIATQALKTRKVEPVMLVASLAELGEIAPAASTATKDANRHKVPKPVLKKPAPSVVVAQIAPPTYFEDLPLATTAFRPVSIVAREPSTTTVRKQTVVAPKESLFDMSMGLINRLLAAWA
jgi:predicted transglutaminase-like cysteine proteinase